MVWATCQPHIQVQSKEKLTVESQGSLLLFRPLLLFSTSHLAAKLVTGPSTPWVVSEKLTDLKGFS